jgi:hypothetical protein
MPPKEQETLRRELARVGRKITAGTVLLSALSTLLIVGDWKGKREAYEESNSKQVTKNTDDIAKLRGQVINIEQVIGIEHSTGKPIIDTVHAIAIK